MYRSSYIPVPNEPGKIVRRKKGNSIYVLYEIGRVYDPKRQFNVPKRVIIGKLASDEPDALMQPNEKYFELFPEIQQSLLEPPSKRSGICQDTSKKLVRSLFTPEEPQQGLCPYASLPQDIFLT